MICNSSPLICLAKINQLHLLKELLKKIIIPEVVKEEVLIEDKPGFEIISRAIDEKWIETKNPQKQLDLKIGKGENAAINLAIEINQPIIIDDALGAKIARSLNVEVLRTTSVILLATKKKIITKKQAVDLLNKLFDIGYYLAPRYYAALLTKLSV